MFEDLHYAPNIVDSVYFGNLVFWWRGCSMGGIFRRSEGFFLCTHILAF